MAKHSERSALPWIMGTILALISLMGVGFLVMRNLPPRFLTDQMLLNRFIQEAQQRPLQWSTKRGGVWSFPPLTPVMEELQDRGGYALQNPLKNVLPLLEHPNADVVAAALRLRKATPLPPFASQLKPWLAKMKEQDLLAHKDRRVRWMALTLMLDMPPTISVEQVEQALNDPEPAIRRLIMEHLDRVLRSRFSDAAYRRKLTLAMIDQLSHESQDVRKAAYGVVFRSLLHAAPPGSPVQRKIINHIMEKGERLEADEGRRMRRRLRRFIEKHRADLDFGRTG